MYHANTCLCFKKCLLLQWFAYVWFDWVLLYKGDNNRVGKEKRGLNNNNYKHLSSNYRVEWKSHYSRGWIEMFGVYG